MKLLLNIRLLNKLELLSGEPCWTRTNDPFLKSKLHNRKLPLNGNFLSRVLRYVGTKCYNIGNKVVVETLHSLYTLHNAKDTKV